MQEITENNLSINDRFRQILEYYGVTRYKFAQISGISEPTILNIYKGKNKPSIDFVEKILKSFEAINALWLITGEGEMLKKDKLLYDKIPPNTEEIRDPGGSYQKKCLLCDQKDQLIAAHQAHINTLLHELHRCQSRLDEIEGNENGAPEAGQKRKVG